MDSGSLIPLIVTLDVERDYSPDWMPPATLMFRSIVEAIPQRLGPLFAEFGVRPTYLLSPEVIANPDCVAVLRAQSGCELGAHLHGEYVAPMVPSCDFRNGSRGITAMQWEYPPEIEQSKLATLTSVFTERFGCRPRSFRAGRFGIGPNTGTFLRDLGYTVDSSVSPHIVWTSQGGIKRPDFRGARELPYFVGEAGDIMQHGDSSLLEVPITILAPGRIAYVDAGQPAWFRPWYSSMETLKAVVDHVAVRPTPNGHRRPLVMMFHSEELVPGASPYPQTEADVDRYLDDLKRIFEYSARIGVRPCTLAEYRQGYAIQKAEQGTLATIGTVLHTQSRVASIPSANARSAQRQELKSNIPESTIMSKTVILPLFNATSTNRAPVPAAVQGLRQTTECPSSRPNQETRLSRSPGADSAAAVIENNPSFAPAPITMTNEGLIEEMNRIQWWHRIPLGNGIITPGQVRHGDDSEDYATNRFGLPLSLQGKSVLDVGAWDGYFSFEAERRGASCVVAADISIPEAGKTPDDFGSAGNWGGNKGFTFARKVLCSKVQYVNSSIYDVGALLSKMGTFCPATFDYVFFFGVLYHLKEPLLALEKLGKLTKEVALIETAGSTATDATMQFRPGFDGDPSNWWYPSFTCLKAMLLHSGFREVEMVHDMGPRFTVRACK